MVAVHLLDRRFVSPRRCTERRRRQSSAPPPDCVRNVVAFLQVAERTGALVEVIPSDETGQISVEALEGMLDDRVKLIAITHVPTNGGLVNPAAAVGKV